MIHRCLAHDTGKRNWKYYGGRGIQVCQRWLHSFENFLSDMGRRPSLKHSIDRRKQNGDYTPKNCRWATPAEQRRNCSRNINLTFNGRTMCVMDWSTELGIQESTIRARLKRGWSVERSLTAPLTPIGKYER
jgi:hypothetical protein